LFYSLFFSLSLQAEENLLFLGLKESIEKALFSNHEIKESHLKVQQSEKDFQLVKMKYRPQFDLMLGLGPINKAYGDAVQSTDADLVEFDSWGLLVMATVETKVPIYTWGQREDYLAATKMGKIVQEQEVVKTKNTVTYKVKELYYGILLAATIRSFIIDVEGDINKAIDELKRKRKRNKESLYQLNIFKNQLLAKKAEIDSQYIMAQKALAYYTGQPVGTLVHPKEEWLEFDRKRVKPFDYYKDLFFKHRPELKQVNAGIEAKHSLASATNKSRFPMLGIIGKYDFSYTSAREKQNSVFAYDPYNKNSFVLGVGFTWQLDWGISRVEAQKYRLEKRELEHKKVQAESGLVLDLRKKWEEVKYGREVVKRNSKARKYAKKWLNSIVMKAGIGSSLNTDQFAKAYQARAMTFKNYLESLYKYYLSWAKLSKAVGTEIDPALSE
jgi:outer membrane protein TolC